MYSSINKINRLGIRRICLFETFLDKIAQRKTWKRFRNTQKHSKRPQRKEQMRFTFYVPDKIAKILLQNKANKISISKIKTRRQDKIL